MLIMLTKKKLTCGIHVCLAAGAETLLRLRLQPNVSAAFGSGSTTLIDTTLNIT
jgi:hypothetical protein